MQPRPEKVEPNKIELAVAAHVFVEGFTKAKHDLATILEEIKTKFQNPALTTRDIKRAIADWLIKGYAVIKENCLCVTRTGRKHIEALAEVETAPAPLMA